MNKRDTEINEKIKKYLDLLSEDKIKDIIKDLSDKSKVYETTEDNLIQSQEKNKADFISALNSILININLEVYKIENNEIYLSKIGENYCYSNITIYLNSETNFSTATINERNNRYIHSDDSDRSLEEFNEFYNFVNYIFNSVKDSFLALVFDYLTSEKKNKDLSSELYNKKWDCTHLLEFFNVLIESKTKWKIITHYNLEKWYKLFKKYLIDNKIIRK